MIGRPVENHWSFGCEDDAYFCNGKAHLYLDVTEERVSHFYEMQEMKIPESVMNL